MSESVRSGQQRIELRQSIANALSFPIFIGIVLVAVAARVQGSQSTVVYIVCAVAGVLLVVLVGYLLRNRARLVVTRDNISFIKGQAAGAQQVIQRVDGSSLTFRVAANGPVGSEHTGYVLKLRDKATGHEVYAGAFGRKDVRQACEAQGWSFDAG